MSDYKEEVQYAIKKLPNLSLNTLKKMNLDETGKVNNDQTKQNRDYNEVLAAVKREAILGIAVRFSPTSQEDSNLKDFELLCALDRVLLLKRELNIIAPLIERTFSSMTPISFEDALKVVEKHLKDPSNIKEKVNPNAQSLLIKELEGMKTELLEIIRNKSL